ncbi:hypothetical protein [Micromonospora sp. DH14]|uniref:hypothetical protein n=1 Tax=Micromonospora sp. DH14 TaxID=3040120 RepID=UPI002442D6CC|nr:hypothetical protein [Micromonospora sp. DH14]MDG9674884.1 hypothetical protein [Micromonospora sp. DH14]
MRAAAATAARDAEDLTSDELADRVLDAVVKALFASTEVKQQIRDLPPLDSLPSGTTMANVRTERRLAIFTPPEPCAGYGSPITKEAWLNVGYAEPSRRTGRDKSD